MSAPRLTAAAPPAGRKIRVLCVDDSALVRSLMTEIINAQSKPGTTVSTRAVRKRSTRGLSIRQTRSSTKSMSAEITIRTRRTGALKSTSELRSRATGCLSSGGAGPSGRPVARSAVVVYHMPKLLFVFQRLAGAERDTIQ